MHIDLLESLELEYPSHAQETRSRSLFLPWFPRVAALKIHTEKSFPVDLNLVPKQSENGFKKISLCVCYKHQFAVVWNAVPVEITNIDSYKL